MIYLLKGSADGEEVDCVEPGKELVLMWLDGSPMGADWTPLAVQRIEPDPPAAPTSDLIWYTGSTLVMRQRAVDALRDILEQYGEILPLADTQGVPLFAWNVTRVIDALDEPRCQLRRFEDGHIQFIHEHVFHEELVRGVDAFRLPFSITNSIYVADGFVARVRAAGLTGLDFDPCWSAEGGPIRRAYLLGV